MIKRFLFWFARRYRHNTASRWAILLIDLFTLVVAFAVTDLFRLRMVEQIDWPSLIVKLVAFMMLATICYLIIGTYRSIIRHSGMYDIYKVLISNGIAACILILFNLVNNSHHIVINRYTPAYSEILMTFALQIVNMLTVRLMLQRIYNDYVRRQKPVRNVVIYGAGSAGTIAYNALTQDRLHDYKVVAYIDDDKQKNNTALNGVHVMERNAVLNSNFIEKNKISILIIAIPSIKLNIKQEITTKALDYGLTVKSVPHIDKWINDSFSYSQIQDIEIEDLLERERPKMDPVNIIREVVDKVIVVTGAAGSIGKELCRQLIQLHPSKLIMIDQAESSLYEFALELRNNESNLQIEDKMAFIIANITDKDRMKNIYSRFHPNIVFHLAAYKHVPTMEDNPYEAVKVNVYGTRILADISTQYKVEKFVLISSDKAVNPTNIMGATKRLAEIYVQNQPITNTHFITTRFGNVLGSEGSVIPLFKKQLTNGGPLTVTHRDSVRYFMTIPETSNLILESCAMGSGGDIFVFDMGSPVKIYNLAQKMIQLSGLKNIEIKEVGLRPGEKLYEELLATKENTLPTYHPKILRAEVRKYPMEDIDKKYAELWDAMKSFDDMLLVRKMKEIVPEFKSQNSIFCSLDQPDSVNQ